MPPEAGHLRCLPKCSVRLVHEGLWRGMNRVGDPGQLAGTAGMVTGPLETPRNGSKRPLCAFGRCSLWPIKQHFYPWLNRLKRI